MANRAGLRKVVKTVRGKHGAVRRSYWVKAQGAAQAAGRAIGRGARAVGSFAKAHPLVTAGILMAATGGAAYGAHALLAAHGMSAAGAIHAVGSYASTHFAAAHARAVTGLGIAAARIHGGLQLAQGHSGLVDYKKTLVSNLGGSRGLLLSSNGQTFGTNASGATYGWSGSVPRSLTKIGR